MKSCKRIAALALALVLLLSLCACAQDVQETEPVLEETLVPTVAQEPVNPERQLIEEKLNLANNPDQEWKYSGNAWVLTPVSAVAYPELPEQQGVSVCVPSAYVIGIDTNGEGKAGEKYVVITGFYAVTLHYYLLFINGVIQSLTKDHVFVGAHNCVSSWRIFRPVRVVGPVKIICLQYDVGRISCF